MHLNIVSTSGNPGGEYASAISASNYEFYQINSAWFTMNISVIEYEGENLSFRFGIYQDPQWGVETNIFSTLTFVFMLGSFLSFPWALISYSFYNASKSISKMTDAELIEYWENRPEKNKKLTIVGVLLIILGGLGFYILMFTFPRFAKANTAKKELNKRGLH